MLEKIKKQPKIIFIAIGIVVLLGLIGGGYYWWAGTPEYSISQIKKAIKTHNKELGLKYIDVDTIFENFWTDMKSEAIEESAEAEGLEAFGMMLGLQMFENIKPVMKERLKEGIESWFLVPEEPKEKPTTTEGVSGIWQKDLEIKKRGNSVYIETLDGIKIIFTKKEKERYWVITKIEGLTEMASDISGNIEEETKKAGKVLPNKLKEKVDVELLDKGFEPSDIHSGVYEDYITIKLRFINKTNKDTKGVQGKIIFYDIFDNEIYQVKISYDEEILKNESKIWKGQIEYNQFKDEHKKLRNTEFENLKYEWLPDTIIYQDGSRETE